MRPVQKGASPNNYVKYQDAISDLSAALGWYCSYCEQPIKHVPEVEHVLPKSLNHSLVCCWSNFLLACKSCNTAKGNNPVNVSNTAFPDIDNTFLALSYPEDGSVLVSTPNPSMHSLVTELVNLVKLHRHPTAAAVVDRPSAKDRRVDLRCEAWAKAKRSLRNYETVLRDYGQNSAACEALLQTLTDLIEGTGFFSIWMAAFSSHPRVLNLVIQKFVGTHPDCFDSDGAAVTHPTGRF